ncbi:cell cycle family protein [Lapidilactobacillus dextrinicus DSM 20335]|uniref:Probable peptidoglycan glycosyltransferase FtsW n=1 Tax=Lapidilactobacillus dextrinicus DSM 20335 TaxID=1423738 RepID=A0A0R2BIW7_9LACO|nr:FtsW/RodA/SpoVE family cell cycle protein [Lapidilactobacillus dextrinicus]KRM78466.1 cell cycle family protein [Lapidilactobacillus dextrinicus DSM 20335]QFG47265.1 FtsW/RodA/SpoVE family cell cycle protein [Lapidilactobacillus dextrinicus]
MKEKLRRLDPWILIPYLLLVVIGIIMVYSASSGELIASNLSPTMYLKRQAIFAVVGLVAAAVTYWFRARFWYSKGTVMIAVISTLGLLLLLRLISHFNPSAAQNGAVGWINIGPFNIQPVEIAKLTLVLYFAYILGRREKKLINKRPGEVFAAPLALTVLFVVLTMIQPDLGGALILSFIAVVLIGASGVAWWFTVVGGVGILGLFGILVNIIGHLNKSSFLLKISGLKLYQLDRFRSFLHPFQLEQHGGAQLVNSYYAINNGGWFGRGLGNSIQKLGYLPEPYTDFILSITAEELGIVGATLILILLGILIVRSLLIGMRSRNTYHMLVCYGVSAILFVQTFINVGGLLGLIPITGVTLPFISYGGSSIIILSICMGLVLNISATEKRKREKRVR